MTHNRITKASFADIKKELDPSRCYLIIENRAKKGILADFETIIGHLNAIGPDALALSFYEDPASAKLLLVVSFETCVEEKIRENIIFSRLPDHMVIYLYKCTSGSMSHTVSEL